MVRVMRAHLALSLTSAGSRSQFATANTHSKRIPLFLVLFTPCRGAKIGYPQCIRGCSNVLHQHILYKFAHFQCISLCHRNRLLGWHGMHSKWLAWRRCQWLRGSSLRGGDLQRHGRWLRRCKNMSVHVRSSFFCWCVCVCAVHIFCRVCACTLYVYVRCVCVPGPQINPQFFWHHALGSVLMTRGSCGAKAPPSSRAQLNPQFEFFPQDINSIKILIWIDWWLLLLLVKVV